MSITIKLRRGNKSEWDSNGNIVLASGEPGYELDTGRFKIGNGLTAWSGLSYASIIPTGFLAGTGINLELGPNGQYLTINASGGAIISNYGNNRLLTSDGTTTGINGENNLTFDGSQLFVSGEIVVDQLNFNDNIISTTGNNLPLVLSPNGIGALQRNSAGNTRGADAVDWGGGGGDYVAGGFASVIGGGGSNKISSNSEYGIINGGFNNTISGINLHYHAIINGGFQNKIINGGKTVICGGEYNTASGTYNAIVGGYSNDDGGYQNVFILGSNLTAQQDNTTYTQNLSSQSGNFTDLTVNNTAVSLSGHSHTASNITDFNSAVSGLLPVKNIIAGTGISIINNFGIFTVTSTGSGVLADQATSIVTTVFNKTTDTINKGSVVYINGGQGDQPTIQLAIASNEAGSSKTYGITAENIASMNTGKVVVMGALTGFNTDQFNPTAPVGDVNGTILYLSPSVSGAMTTTKPYAPNHLVSVGTIVRTHQNEGVIEVRIQNGFELEELHNVAVSGVTNGQFLQYNSSSQLWIPTSSGNFTTLLVNGTGVSVSGHTHTASQITDFNEAVDDRIGNGLFVAGTGINLNYNDGSNSFTVSVTGLINNPANNRVLTSRDSTTTGIDAESNLTFNDNTLAVSGLVSATSGNFINSLQFNGINYLDTTTYIVARPGDNLLTKYTEAKALTPRGIAKSATNRASLIVMPGTYVLSSELTVDTQFVDIIGLGSQTKKPAVLLTTNTINVTANDVRVQGISVGDQNFKIADNKPLQIIENCVGNSMFSFGGYDLFSGGSQLTISGTFIGCSSSGMWSFAGAGTASGRFIDCEGGASSFGGGGGIVSGYFERCIGGDNSFGGGGLVSGTFLYCIGGSTSFGGGGGGPSFGPHTGTPEASGVFKYCSAGDSSFGGGDLSTGIASGIFLYCNASNGSFGGFGSGSLANGTFRYCTGSNNSFCCGAGSLASGYFEYCSGGQGSFAGSNGASGDTTGTFNYCVAGDISFGSNINGFYNNCIAGNDSFKAYIGGILNYCKAGTNSFGADLGGTISGVLNNCVGGNNSFKFNDPVINFPTITGKLQNCIISSGNFATPASGGKLINCIDGDGNVITIT